MKRDLVKNGVIPWVIAGVAVAALMTMDLWSWRHDNSRIEAVAKRLEREEGFRAHAYDDSRGVLTIGYGTNIQQGITRTEAGYLLRQRLEHVREEIKERWVPWGVVPEVAQDALLDMGYQLGVDGLLGFHHMLAAVAEGNWGQAAVEARRSKWAEETPVRARRVIAVFEKLLGTGG